MEGEEVTAAEFDLAGSMVPNIRDLGPNILVAGVLPFVVYALIRPHLSSDATGLAIVMVFPVLEIGYERRRRGRFEPIGIIALIGIALGLIGALLSGGDAMLLKIRESAITGAFGLVCLVSLTWRRPMMWFLGREFATGGDPDKRAAFEQVWDFPGSPVRFRVVTLVWGVGLVAEAVGRTALALLLSTGIFLITSFIFNGVVLVGLFAFTIRYSRAGQERTRAEMERLGMTPDLGAWNDAGPAIAE
jgi:hypothetical protein